MPAHEVGFGRDGLEGAPAGGAEDAQAEEAEIDALGEGDAGAGAGGPPEGKEADEGNGPIAEEVEGVGLEGLAAGEEAADGFDDAEAEIEADDDPEGAAIGGIAGCAGFIGMAAAGITSGRIARDRGC